MWLKEAGPGTKALASSRGPWRGPELGLLQDLPSLASSGLVLLRPQALP